MQFSLYLSFRQAGRLTQGHNIRVKRKGDMHRGDSGAYTPLYHRKPRLTGFNTFSAKGFALRQTMIPPMYNAVFCHTTHSFANVLLSGN